MTTPETTDKKANSKLPPEAFGCARPYTLTAKAKVVLAPEDSAKIRRFVTAHTDAARALLSYFMELYRGSLEHRVTLSLLVTPSKDSPEVLEHPRYLQALHSEIQIVPRKISELLSIGPNEN